jgi:hypothetical protein
MRHSSDSQAELDELRSLRVKIRVVSSRVTCGTAFEVHASLVQISEVCAFASTLRLVYGNPPGCAPIKISSSSPFKFQRGQHANQLATLG